ncbi:MAG: hypothetical protein ACYS8W_15375 [Planctomycetota bacterium]
MSAEINRRVFSQPDSITDPNVKHLETEDSGFVENWWKLACCGKNITSYIIFILLTFYAAAYIFGHFLVLSVELYRNNPSAAKHFTSAYKDFLKLL